jgi:PAS domain S-box-containing protein
MITVIREKDILKSSILIVDDQDANISLLEEILREVGYQQITSTTDPTSVAAMHYANCYDLILLDLLMPGMDGFQVMEDLKVNVGDDYLPILVLTVQSDHKLRALATGAKDFIAKPFDLAEVKTRIHNMLEVRLLYKKLGNYNQELEQTVLERTAELCESEGRYRSLIELAADWYWEQDESGNFIHVFGPVAEMLGIQDDALLEDSQDAGVTGWNEKEREQLHSMITRRQPFLDFIISRIKANGTEQKYMVSGEPMFNQSARFVGYRGIGVEFIAKNNSPDVRA